MRKPKHIEQYEKLKECGLDAETIMFDALQEAIQEAMASAFAPVWDAMNKGWFAITPEINWTDDMVETYAEWCETYLKGKYVYSKGLSPATFCFEKEEHLTFFKLRWS